MHTRWPTFGALIGGIALVASLWYVVLANPEGEAVPASGGSYTEGVTRSAERINPLFAAANPTDRDLSALIFSGLVRLAPDGTPLPDLAERWEITGSGTGYVFHLRDGVAWHGDPDEPFDAEDVVFTFEAIADPEFRGDPALAALMDGVVVEARDTLTVEFRLEQAYAPFLARLTVGILPEHLLRDLDADGLFNSAFNVQPIGTGPYRFRGRTQDGIVLESNSTYHFGPPHISTLEMRTYAGNGEIVEALRGGAIDGALLPPDARGGDIAFLRDDGGFRLQDLGATSLAVVYFDTRSDIFSDAVVRQAFVQAVNRQTLVDDAADGRGVPAVGVIPPSSWAAGEDAEAPDFSPGDAARDLERAGWARGRDGVRQKVGLRLSVMLSTSTDAAQVRIAEDVARQWRAIGAEVELLTIDAGTYVEEHLLGRQFETALAEIDAGADPDPYAFWHSSQAAAGGHNLSGYSDPAIDEALERARQTTEIDRRAELYAEFTEAFLDASPSLPLFHPVWTYVQNDDVQGFQPSLLITPASRFANVNGWFVRTRVE